MRPTYLRPTVVWILALAFLGVGSLHASARTVGDDAAKDEAITARVSARLAEHPDTAGFEISVDVVNAVVTLRGEVDSEKTKEKAGKLTLAARGVKEVRNAIKVVAPEEE